MGQKEEIDQLEKMLKSNKNLSESVRNQIKNRIASLKSSIGMGNIKMTSSNQNGVQLFGQLLAKKERAVGEKGPSSFRFQIIQTPKRPYWKAESDYGEEMKMKDIASFIEEQNKAMAKSFKEDEFIPVTEVVNCDQQEIDLENIHNPDENVLVMKVRGKGDKPRTPFGQKPIARYMVLRNSDQLWVSIFADKVANGVDNGGYVTVRGFLINDYQESSRPNCKTISAAKLDQDELDQEMFELNCKQHPRFKNAFMKIEEDVPSDWTEKVSADLHEFLTTPTQICSWPTRDTINEIVKPDTALFSEITITDYNYEINDDSGEKRKLNQISFQQQVDQYKDGELTKIMLVVKLNPQKCSELLGITNTKVFEKLAEKHAKNMRFALFAYPNHKSTLALNINDPSQKDENMRDFSHGLEYRTMGSTYLVHNLLWFLINKSLPLDFKTVEELFGTNELTYEFEDGERNPNPYDGSKKSKLGKKFVNLSEYTGSLDLFAKDYQFRILTTDKPKDVGKIMKIENEEERIKKCCEDLLGKTDEDDMIIAKVELESIAIYAIHNDLVKDCKENESMRSLDHYVDMIETRQEKFQPGQENQSSDDELQKDDSDMKVDEESKQEKDNSVKKDTKKSAKRKRKQEDDEEEKEKDTKKTKKPASKTKGKKATKKSDDDDDKDESDKDEASPENESSEEEEDSSEESS